MENLIQHTQTALHLFVLHPPDRGAWEQQSSGRKGLREAWERGGGMLSGTLGGWYTRGHGKNVCLTEHHGFPKLLSALRKMKVSTKATCKGEMFLWWFRKGHGLGLFYRHQLLGLAPMKREFFSRCCPLIHGSCAVTFRPQLKIRGGRCSLRTDRLEMLWQGLLSVVCPQHSAWHRCALKASMEGIWKQEAWDTLIKIDPCYPQVSSFKLSCLIFVVPLKTSSCCKNHPVRMTLLELSTLILFPQNIHYLDRQWER